MDEKTRKHLTCGLRSYMHIQVLGCWYTKLGSPIKKTLHIESTSYHSSFEAWTNCGLFSAVYDLKSTSLFSFSDLLILISR